MLMRHKSFLKGQICKFISLLLFFDASTFFLQFISFISFFVARQKIMPSSSYISLASITAISAGGAYLTLLPRNNSSTWNILGRKIAVGVMISGAVGWIFYWSFKKPPIKKRKTLPKLTTIRKRRTSKTSSSSAASSTKSSSKSSTTSAPVKTKDDFISSPTNVSMSGTSPSTSSQSLTSLPSMLSTQTSTVSKVESNGLPEALDKKVDEKAQINLLPSDPTSVLPIPDPTVSKVEKVEPPKFLKIDEPLTAVIAPTVTKDESVGPTKIAEKVESTSSKLPEKQQIELLPLPPPLSPKLETNVTQNPSSASTSVQSLASELSTASTQNTTVSLIEELPKALDKKLDESISQKLYEKQQSELPSSVPSTVLPASDATVSKVESIEALPKIVEKIIVQSPPKIKDEPLTASTQDATVTKAESVGPPKDLEKVESVSSKLPEKQVELPPSTPTVLPTPDTTVSKVENNEIPPKILEKKTVQSPKQPEVCDCGVEAMDDKEKYSEETTMPNLIHPINFPNKTIILPMSYERYQPVNLIIPTEEQTHLSTAVMQKHDNKEDATMLTPFRPILHSMYYAHRHAMLVEDLLHNYQFLED